MSTKADVVAATLAAYNSALALPDGPIPPVPPGPIVCAGFANTWVIDLTYKVGFQSGVVVPVFGPNDIVVARFSTPDTITNGGEGGYIGAVETVGPCPRTMCISTLSCDFTPNTAGKHGTPTNILTNTPAPTLYFGPPNSFTLLPDTLYYVNIKNGATGQANNPILVTLQAR